MALPKVTDDLPVAKSNRYFSVSIFLGLFIVGAFVPFEHSFLLHVISPPFFPSTIPASTATPLDPSCPLLFCSLLEFWCPVGSCLSVGPWNCVQSLDLITPTSTLNQDLFLLWSDIRIQLHIGQIHKMCYSFIHSFIHSFKYLLGFLCQTLFDVRARWTEFLSSGSSYSGVDTAFIACHFCFSVGLVKIFALSLLLQYLIKVSPCYLSCQVLPERTIPTRYSCLPLWAFF